MFYVSCAGREEEEEEDLFGGDSSNDASMQIPSISPLFSPRLLMQRKKLVERKTLTLWSRCDAVALPNCIFPYRPAH